MDTILADGQFEPIHGEITDLRICLNTTSQDEHVPEVEQYIRTLKECVRACYNILPFDKYPCCLIIEMVYTQNFWLNAFPHVDGISQMMSLKEIITGFKVNILQHCKLEFGDYMQTHEEHMNDMRSCTIGALSLQPTRNSQGGYYFYSLMTGCVITRQQYTLVRMPCKVIDHVHHKVWRENTSTGLSILNCWREEILEEPVHPMICLIM